MRVRLLLILIFTITIFMQGCAKEAMQIEKSKLSSDELAMFQKIKKIYPDFYFSEEVFKYFKRDSDTKIKMPFLIEMIFPKKENLYFDKFISYSVCYEPDSRIIKYSFDAGTAARGEGTIVFSEDKILDIQWLCGTAGCQTYISENNKIIYPQ